MELEEGGGVEGGTAAFFCCLLRGRPAFLGGGDIRRGVRAVVIDVVADSGVDAGAEMMLVPHASDAEPEAESKPVACKPPSTTAQSIGTVGDGEQYIGPEPGIESAAMVLAAAASALL